MASRLRRGSGHSPGSRPRAPVSVFLSKHLLRLLPEPSLAGSSFLYFQGALSLCRHGSRTFDLWTHSPVGLLSFFHQTSPSCRLISLRPSSVRLSRMAEQRARGLRVLTSPRGAVFSGTPSERERLCLGVR